MSPQDSICGNLLTGKQIGLNTTYGTQSDLAGRFDRVIAFGLEFSTAGKRIRKFKLGSQFTAWRQGKSADFACWRQAK